MSQLSPFGAAASTAPGSAARLMILAACLWASVLPAAARQAAPVAAAAAPGVRTARAVDPARTGEAPPAAQPIRALYVTGGGFHDFVAQETIVPPGIAARTSIEWTIDHTAGKSTEVLIPRHRDTRWADEFDVVVYNMSFSHVVDVEWIERIVRAHREKGVAAVILHGATHSYRRSESDAWGQLMGAFSMRHDRQRPFGVERLAPDHPIMKSFPQDWSPGSDELYQIIKTWPGMTPLAQAWSVQTEEHSPVVWTNTFGNARVFVTTMGHNNATMADPVYLDLVTRGLLWTLGRLQEDGRPADGYGPPAAGK